MLKLEVATLNRSNKVERKRDDLDNIPISNQIDTVKRTKTFLGSKHRTTIRININNVF